MRFDDVDDDDSGNGGDGGDSGDNNDIGFRAITTQIWILCLLIQYLTWQMSFLS